MKSKSFVRDSVFLQSFRIVKSNLGISGMIILFDLMFLVSFLTMQKLFDYSAPAIISNINANPLLLFFVLSSLYYLILLFVYSIFKFSVIGFVKSLFFKSRPSFREFWKFYALNLAIALVFLAVMLVLDYVLANLKPDFAPYVFLVMAVPYALILYASVNISQSLLCHGNSLTASLKKGFAITFAEIKRYRELVLVMIISAAALWIIFVGVGYLIRVSTSANYTLYLKTYSVFGEASKWAISIVFYFLIFINRISFYQITQNKR
ncbi:MAG TPA: hypothetical protein VJJ52_04650 [Candidatus Nanoarchaeia archaeon]|nr:hypothetical protein [Candidatus Nanoarchaeia archaeon]